MAYLFGFSTLCLALYLVYQKVKHETELADLRRIKGEERDHLQGMINTAATDFVHLKTQTDIALDQKDEIIGREVIKRQNAENKVAELAEGLQPSLWRYKKGKQSVWKYSDHEVPDASVVEAFTRMPEVNINDQLQLEI